MSAEWLLLSLTPDIKCTAGILPEVDFERL